MSPSRRPKNGLDEFYSRLRDLRKLWAWIVAAAVLPFLAVLARIAPPWPPAVAYLTSIVCVLAMIVAHQIFRTSSLKSINKLILVCLGVLAVTSVAYLSVLSQFTYDAPGAKVSRVKGFTCTDIGLKSFPAKCPWYGELELRQSEWEAEYLWTTWSIGVVRVALVSLWSAAIMSLSLAFSGFIVFQARQMRN